MLIVTCLSPWLTAGCERFRVKVTRNELAAPLPVVSVPRKAAVQLVQAAYYNVKVDVWAPPVIPVVLLG